MFWEDVAGKVILITVEFSGIGEAFIIAVLVIMRVRIDREDVFCGFDAFGLRVC